MSSFIAKKLEDTGLQDSGRNSARSGVQFRNSASGMRPEDSREGLRPGAFNAL